MENQRVRITRMMLKGALISLMQEKEIGKISIKEICERAELNRTTFYLHYPDPYALLADIEEDLLQQVRKTLDNISPDSSGIDYIESFLQYIKDNRETAGVLLTSSSRYDFRSRMILAAFEGLQENLVIHEDEELDPFVYQFLICGCNGMLVQWIEEDYRTDIPKLARLMYSLSDRTIGK